MRRWSHVSVVVAGVLIWSACGNTAPETNPPNMSPDAGEGVDMSSDMSTGPGDVTPDVVDPVDMSLDAAPDVSQDMGAKACEPACSGTTPVCDVPRTVCVECVTDADCADTMCDTTSNTCAPPEVRDPDTNQNGTLDILVLGTSRSIQPGGEPFVAEQIATELGSILAADSALSVQVNVVARDIYTRKPVLLGLGQGGTEYTWDHARHSLAQFYYWPEGREARMDDLAGRGDVDWDHVIIGADPHLVATLPGYYALGANKIAAKVAEGGGQPHLLMMWPKDDASIDHFAEHTHRVSSKARVSLPVISTGRAWQALPAGKRDTSSAHPTPNGAYLAAASIYSHLYDRSASASEYAYDDEIAQVAQTALMMDADGASGLGARTSESPFKGGEVADRILRYKHTGTSSERGILGGLRWVLSRARVELRSDGPPYTFNFGRANTNFEEDKRYEVDPAQYTYSMGFPMQDHGTHGDLSMLYGLDLRIRASENGTDLGTALHMVREGELRYAKAVPIRTLYAQIKEATPTRSAYRDAWHMHRDLDKAAAAFMYTLLTGHCSVDEEPATRDSDEWREWKAHKIGHETAWNVMHLSGVAPCLRVLPDSVESVSVQPMQSAGLSISFGTAPTSNVTVTLTSSNDAAATFEPKVLVFTPQNHDTPQVVTMTGSPGQPAEDAYIMTASTSSSDVAFDGLQDRWEYKVVRE